MAPQHHIRDWSPLAQSLETDTAVTEQLRQLLAEERLQLEERRYEQFETLLGQKLELLTTLETNAKSRRDQLATLGIHSETEALALLIDQAPDLAERWQQLATCWQDCQQANQINEQICQRTRQVVTRVLDLLHGQPGQGNTYDNKGLSQRLQNGRPISRA